MDFTQAEQEYNKSKELQVSLKYIKEIKHVNLWNAGYVKKFDFSMANSCEEARIEAVTEVANTCHGDKGIKDREKLYQQLLTEHDGKPGEVFQFVPTDVRVWNQTKDKHKNLIRFGYEYDDGFLTSKSYLSNNRALFNDKQELYNEQLSGFHVFKIKIPMMIVQHILRHGQLSFMQVSERTQKLREYYYCDEFDQVLKDCNKNRPDNNLADWNEICYMCSQCSWDNIQQKYSIRQELTNKGSHGLAYVTMWIAGWEQDDSGFTNFFNVRRKKPSQIEIRQLANTMYEMIYGG